MSDSNSIQRQQAQRVTGTELQASTVVEQLGDKQQSPRKQLLATGQWAGKVLIAGTLTDTEQVAEDYWRGQVNDGDTTISVYGGQYQEDSLSFLQQADAPMYVMVVGKPDTYERDDGSVLVSLTAKQIVEIDAETREQWAYECAQMTQERLASFDPEAEAVPKQSNPERAYAEYAVERVHEEIRDSAVSMLNTVFDIPVEKAEADDADADSSADEQGLAAEYDIDNMDYNELNALVASKTEYSGGGSIDVLREKARGTYSPAEEASA